MNERGKQNDGPHTIPPYRGGQSDETTNFSKR